MVVVSHDFGVFEVSEQPQSLAQPDDFRELFPDRTARATRKVPAEAMMRSTTSVCMNYPP
jgi:hypothetical protein